MERRTRVKASSSGTERLDRISALPQHLIEEILLRLSLMDAVRTSVLSSKWRNKWTTLPQIVFDDCYNPCGSRSLSGGFIRKAIDTIFSFHPGPVKAFKLFLYAACPEDSDVCRWIRHLSRLSINKLEIHILCHPSHHDLGSCLFACHDLISLKLIKCSFRLPSNFTGLKNLINLSLNPAPVAQDMLENLLSSCPQLMKLEIFHIRFSHLTISALNLQYLVVHGCLKRVKIDAPNLQQLDLECLLEDIDVNTSCLCSLRLFLFDCWDPIHGRDPIHGKADAISRCLVKLFALQSQLKYVDLDHYFIQYLSLTGFPDTMCNSLVHLKHLKVILNFTSVEEVSATLCLIRSCPTLESIVFSQQLIGNEEGDASAVSKFLQDYSSCLFKQLKNVWIQWISNNVAQISFIKFVMSSSPILEHMIIKPLSDSDGGCFELLRQLWQCPRPNRALVFYINSHDRLKEPIKQPTYKHDQMS